MKNNLQNHLFNGMFITLKWIFYLCFLCLWFAAAYMIYIHYPPLFERLLKLWPIGILILSVFLQYLYFETSFSGFLFLAGFLFIIGIIFNINLHKSFYNNTMELPILLIAFASSILNYYVFKRRNIFLLPFVFILILSGILLILIPLYIHYLKSSSLYLYLIIIVLVSTYMFLKSNPKY